MSYIDFEGEIPRGNYGAGAVTVWDTGTYDCLKWEEREVMVVLHGKRVEGRYVLFQTHENQWMIHRMDPPQDPTREAMPERVEPMRPTPGDLPADDGAYGFEIAWDGLRAIVFGQGGRVQLHDEAADDVSARFPEMARLGRALGSHEVILDGELVALGEGGRPDRDRLARRLAGTEGESDSARRRLAEDLPVTYMAYDVLYADGHAIVARPYTERRALLDGLDLNGFHWQSPAYHVGDGAALLEVARRQGLSGVVAKKLDSPYRPGEQSPDWIAVRSSSTS
jgi:bifunctional non-homologous end joining protein LigD